MYHGIFAGRSVSVINMQGKCYYSSENRTVEKSAKRCCSKATVEKSYIYNL